MIVGGILSPIENVLTEVLIWLHETGGLTWAWSIVALTVIVRMLLVPVAIRQIHSMQSLQIHAPEMKAIQQRYKNDRQKQSEELMKFYKENKINPYASCLPIVFQIPIFIALFFVLRDFEDEVYPRFAETTLEWLNLINITEPTKDGLGPVLLVIYVDQPADVDVAHVDVDAERRAALDDHAASDRLHPVHPQLPVRADDLLADDQPVDDRARAHHAPADASAGSAPEAVEQDAAEGRRGCGRGRACGRRRRRRLPPFAPALRAESSGRRAAGESGERRHRGARRGQRRDGRRGQVVRAPRARAARAGARSRAGRVRSRLRGRAGPSRRRIHARPGRRERSQRRRGGCGLHRERKRRARVRRPHRRGDRCRRHRLRRRARRSRHRHLLRRGSRPVHRQARTDDRRDPVPGERGRACGGRRARRSSSTPPATAHAATRPSRRSRAARRARRRRREARSSSTP